MLINLVNMKKFITFALMTAFMVISCSKFDDSAIWDKLNNHESRIAYLEEVCKKMNIDILNLQTIVTALETNDYIVNASPLTTGDGYTFIFKSGKSVVIYNGKDGVDGTDGKDGIDGKDGVTPTIGVMKDIDGVYYWTINNEWLLVNGEKVKAAASDGKRGEDGKDGEDGRDGKDGVTPKFMIEDDCWFVSYDNGKTWENLGKSTEKENNSLFSDVSIDEHLVIVTLRSGTVITIPRNSTAGFTIEAKICANLIVFSGVVDSNSPDLEVGVIYSNKPDVKVYNSTKICTYQFAEDGSFNFIIRDITPNTTIYYRSYILMNGVYAYSDVKQLMTDGEPANSYIITKSGSYAFPTVKGNSTETVGDVATAEVLWESFGTTETPSVGDLIKSVQYRNGIIYYETANTYRKGNAVIAAKDSEGDILWSWHIWFTDHPSEYTLYNSAGVIMDRNMGAISASPGNIGALGLLYQWGRKDPFLGSSSTGGYVVTNSTISWPDVCNERKGMSYAIKNPTTEIKKWYESGALWSEKTKTINDPCPTGWKVANNDNYSKAGLSKSDLNSTKKGFAFYDGLMWFPLSASGSRTGQYGEYWTCTYSSYVNTSDVIYNNYKILRLYIGGTMSFTELAVYSKAAVRCVKNI